MGRGGGGGGGGGLLQVRTRTWTRCVEERSDRRARVGTIRVGGTRVFFPLSVSHVIYAAQRFSFILYYTSPPAFIGFAHRHLKCVNYGRGPPGLSPALRAAALLLGRQSGEYYTRVLILYARLKSAQLLRPRLRRRALLSVLPLNGPHRRFTQSRYNIINRTRPPNASAYVGFCQTFFFTGTTSYVVCRLRLVFSTKRSHWRQWKKGLCHSYY